MGKDEEEEDSENDIIVKKGSTKDKFQQYKDELNRQ